MYRRVLARQTRRLLECRWRPLRGHLEQRQPTSVCCRTGRRPCSCTAVEIEGDVLSRELRRCGTYFAVFAPKTTRRAHDRSTLRYGKMQFVYDEANTEAARRRGGGGGGGCWFWRLGEVCCRNWRTVSYEHDACSRPDLRPDSPQPPPSSRPERCCRQQHATST